ncbi:MAG TPA: hypothetical protein PKC30_02105 [Saprospiraceae bacterium]|nr:hypothetical protein [Saprospiraceae bacterium]
MFLRIFTLKVLWLTSIAVYIGQENILMNIKKDTILMNKYNGTISFNYFIDSTENLVWDSKMTFDSELHGISDNRQIGYEELNIIGNFKESKPEGNWTIINTIYYLLNPQLQKTRTLRLNHQIGGIKDQYNILYENGKRNGTWTLYRQHIDNASIGKERKLGEASFNNDRLINSFFFNLKSNEYGSVHIEGFINESGFLDNQLRLKYDLDSIQILETRTYEDGFLLEISVIDVHTEDFIDEIKYSDVAKLLESLEKRDGEMIIVKDSICYGLTFNNKYDENSKNIIIQLSGNHMLEEAYRGFLKFDRIFGIQEEQDQSFCTRRFKFNYPLDSEQQMDSILNESIRLLSLINQISQRPKFVLRKAQSQSLTLIEHQLGLYSKKIKLIDTTVKFIQSGYFDYNNREEYYKYGISTLDTPDTILFDYEGQTITHILDQKVYITTHKNLLNNFSAILNQIDSHLINIDNEIAQSLIFYDEQDKIDSLELEISKLFNSVDSIYEKHYLYRDKAPVDIPFAYKMYESVNERLIKPTSDQYLNNSVDFNEAVITANKLICLLDFLNKYRKDLDRIGKLPKIWEDSTFTIFQDNPFDYRKFETKILSGIQSAVFILLEHMANNLLNARSCDMLYDELNQILKVEGRVNYLRKNFNDENVKQLDKSLRRERVPQRIFRLLEL